MLRILVLLKERTYGGEPATPASPRRLTRRPRSAATLVGKGRSGSEGIHEPAFEPTPTKGLASNPIRSQGKQRTRDRFVWPHGWRLCTRGRKSATTIVGVGSNAGRIRVTIRQKPRKTNDKGQPTVRPNEPLFSSTSAVPLQS